jgi:hypothetical protein
MTANGRVDLSREVVVGDPVQKSGLRWSVPYNVHDEAGNVADTVWRDVIVEEVKLQDIEKRIRNEILSQQKLEVERTVEKGVREERRRMEGLSTSVDTGSSKCPVCDPCPTSTDDEQRSCPALDAAACAQFCSATGTTTNQNCATDEQSILIQMVRYFEEASFIKPSIMLALLTCLGIVATIIVLRVFVSLILFGESYIRRTQMYTERDMQEEEERQRRLIESVTYYSNGTNGAITSTLRDTNASSTPSFLQNTSNGSTSTGITGNGFVPPPRASMTLGTDRRYLTPPGRSVGQTTNDNLRVPASAPPGISLFGYSSSQNRIQSDLNDIYEAPSPIITPSKRGDGVSRTWSSPHSRS